jgi:hypothetical protein
MFTFILMSGDILPSVVGRACRPLVGLLIHHLISTVIATRSRVNKNHLRRLPEVIFGLGSMPHCWALLLHFQAKSLFLWS